MVGLCRGEAMPAVAVTDNWQSVRRPRIATACAEAGIQPIIGCEIALFGQWRRAQRPLLERNGHGHAAAPDRIVLLVQSETGYRNLMALVSQAYLDARRGPEPGGRRSVTSPRERGLTGLARRGGGPVGRLLAEAKARRRKPALLALQTSFRSGSISNAAPRVAEEARCETGLRRSRLCP